MIESLDLNSWQVQITEMSHLIDPQVPFHVDMGSMGDEVVPNGLAILPALEMRQVC